MSQHHHSNRRDKQLLAEYRAKCEAEGAVCWLPGCGLPIDYSLPSGQGHADAFQRDHYFPASTHPELYNDPSNWRPSHELCNAKRGNRAPTAGAAGLGAPVDAWW